MTQNTIIAEPVHILSLGAGVQSSTLALMAAAGEVTPMPVAAVFADTQAEPPSVYKWLDWLEKQLPFPVHRVTAGSLAEKVHEVHVSKKGQKYMATAIPFFTLSAKGEVGRIMHRTCTRDFKIKPLMKQARDLVCRDILRTWWRDFRKDPSLAPLAVQWIGISKDEITRCKPSRDPWCRSRWPLIERRFTRAMCLDWMQAHGYPQPPRSACVFCPFHSIAEWRRLRDSEPESFQAAVEFERKLQEERKVQENFATTPFLHVSCVPLDQVDLRTDAEHGQLSLWQDECEGMCGV